jgi:hypothetical protein
MLPSCLCPPEAVRAHLSVLCQLSYGLPAGVLQWAGYTMCGVDYRTKSITMCRGLWSRINGTHLTYMRTGFEQKAIKTARITSMQQVWASHTQDAYMDVREPGCSMR